MKRKPVNAAQRAGLFNALSRYDILKSAKKEGKKRAARLRAAADATDPTYKAAKDATRALSKANKTQTSSSTTVYNAKRRAALPAR